MTSLLSAELAATCSALGYFDEKSNKYYADSNTLETVKDLIRYLRRDDETYDIRRQLGETKVLQTDLLPLLKSYWEETDLFDVLLRLIVNLTTPALMLWNEEIPTEKTARNQYLQVDDHLQSYKEAFADEGVWAVLSTRLSKILEIEYAERGDENSLIIERILILIRNVLYVPADVMEKRPDNDASVHDQVLWALHQSGMLDIILYITSSSTEQAYYMHILEVLSFMLREQKASELASAALQRSQTEKIRDETELLAIRHKETNQKQKKVKMYTGTRHSRFGGTFVVKSMKSISDNELIYHKPLNNLEALDFDADKKKPKTPKNRLPFMSASADRRSAFTIRLFLKEFCVEFLNGAYNTLMYSVKDNLVRAKAQAHDESYYLWALRFFMEFNRCYKFEVKLVSETMSVQSFHYVQQQSENYFDLMQTDKKKLKLWSRRLHLALLAYKELYLTLSVIDKSPDGTVKDSAKVIKSNIFYVSEYREFVLTLLINYDPLKMSDTYLKDLMETQHIFLKMFESFCSSEGSVLVRKPVKGKRTRNKKVTVGVQNAAESRELNLDGRWDEAGPQLSAVLEGGSVFLTDVVPFDAASEVPIDDQKADAMVKVQRLLRNGEFERAIGLLRAAREVWPENDSFGSNIMAPEEEFLALRDIFFADLGENTQRIAEQQPDGEESDDEDDDEEEEPQYAETDFSFDEFIKRIPHPKVVKACAIALSRYDVNSVNTNHCIIKLLHRIAFDCKMYVMVFQLSIFRTFQRIFAMKDLPQYKELVKFAIYITRQFFKVSEKNKKVFMEALFWKSKRDAYEIENGYGSYNDKSSAAARVWSEEEEDELRRLFMEHQHAQSEEDVVDWILNNLIDNTKSRRAVLKKLREMCLIIDYKGKKNPSAGRKIPQTWGAQEETQLQELYEQFKDASDPLDCIMTRLEINRPRNRVIDKMLVMGLIQDKKELRKKKAKSGRAGGRKSKPRRNSDGFRSGSDSDSDDYQSGLPTARPRQQTNKISYNAKKLPKKKKNDADVQKIDKSELVKLLLDNMTSGRQDALEWFKESLSDAIEDFEGENNEGIPLVPIMDYAEEAMDTPEFQRLLKAFGVCQPFDEQETYWRIPSHLSVDILRSHCDLIQQALDNTLTILDIVTDLNLEQNELLVETSNQTSSAPARDSDESSDEDYLDKIMKLKPPRPNQNFTSVEPFEDENSLAAARKTRLRIIEDSDEEIETPAVTDTNAYNATRKKSKNIIDSDSEDEQDGENYVIEDEVAPSDDQNNADDLFGRVRGISQHSTSGTSDGQPMGNNIQEDALLEPDDDDRSEQEERETDTLIQKKKQRMLEDSDEGSDNSEMTDGFSKRETNDRIDSVSDEGTQINANENSACTKGSQTDFKRIRSDSDSDSDSENPAPKRCRVIHSDDD